MVRRLPPLAAVLVVLGLAASACAPAEAGSAAAAAGVAGQAVHDVAPDEGAAAREAVLTRYAAGSAERRATSTPSILGRTSATATALLEEAGMDIHVVTFDDRRTITVQWPEAGQPVPLDGVVEAWLGRPAGPVEVAPAQVAPAQVAASQVAAAEGAGQPSVEAPVDQPTEPAPAAAIAASALPAGGGTASSPAYILPPHTPGLLRINPRNLPALPLGTQLTGRASWYGPGFHGLQTACGGIFDRNGPTLASREMRCGTVVRITGPTGLTVEATVTDWGPAEWTGRRFDLSEAVFNAIAPLGTGVIDVRVVTANVPG